MRILVILFLLGCSFVCKSETLQFMGIPFGSDSREFSSHLIKNNFKWITATSNNQDSIYKAELEGDFWKISDCTVYLYSYHFDTFKKTYPIDVVWVLLPTRSISDQRIESKEKSLELYKELVKDFILKYGNYTSESEDYGDYTVNWLLPSGTINVRFLRPTGTLRIEYTGEKRVKELAEKKRFKGRGLNDL